MAVMSANLVSRLDSRRSQFSKADVHQWLGEEWRGGKSHRADFLRRLKWNCEGLPHGSVKQHHQLVILRAGECHPLLMETMHGGGLSLGALRPRVVWQAGDDWPRGQDVGHQRYEDIGTLRER
jgi:hypothetical protein